MTVQLRLLACFVLCVLLPSVLLQDLATTPKRIVSDDLPEDYHLGTVASDLVDTSSTSRPLTEPDHISQSSESTDDYLVKSPKTKKKVLVSNFKANSEKLILPNDKYEKPVLGKLNDTKENETNVVTEEKKEESYFVPEKENESTVVAEEKTENNVVPVVKKTESNLVPEKKPESNAVSEEKNSESNAVPEKKPETNAVSEEKNSESNVVPEKKPESNAVSEDKNSESNVVPEKKPETNALPEEKKESSALGTETLNEGHVAPVENNSTAELVVPGSGSGNIQHAEGRSFRVEDSPNSELVEPRASRRKTESTTETLESQSSTYNYNVFGDIQKVVNNNLLSGNEPLSSIPGAAPQPASNGLKYQEFYGPTGQTDWVPLVSDRISGPERRPVSSYAVPFTDASTTSPTAAPTRLTTEGFFPSTGSGLDSEFFGMKTAAVSSTQDSNFIPSRRVEPARPTVEERIPSSDGESTKLYSKYRGSVKYKSPPTESSSEYEEPTRLLSTELELPPTGAALATLGGPSRPTVNVTTNTTSAEVINEIVKLKSNIKHSIISSSELAPFSFPDLHNVTKEVLKNTIPDTAPEVTNSTKESTTLGYEEQGETTTDVFTPSTTPFEVLKFSTYEDSARRGQPHVETVTVPETTESVTTYEILKMSTTHVPVVVFSQTPEDVTIALSSELYPVTEEVFTTVLPDEVTKPEEEEEEHATEPVVYTSTAYTKPLTSTTTTKTTTTPVAPITTPVTTSTSRATTTTELSTGPPTETPTTTAKEGVPYRVDSPQPPEDELLEADVPAYLRLTVLTVSLEELCNAREELRSAIVKMLSNGTRLPVNKDSVVLLNLHDQRCAHVGPKSKLAETVTPGLLLPVNMFLRNTSGDFDRNLTEAFLTIWSNHGLDFAFPIRKVDFVSPIVGREAPNEAMGPSVVAAIAISCVAGLCLILLGVLFVVMKRRQKKFNYGQRCTPVSLDAYSLDSVSIHNSVRRKGVRASKRSYGNVAFEDVDVPSHTMNFAGLANFSSDKEQLYEEFSVIPQVTPKTDELPAGVDHKNRYANVIPLPETRVVLTVKQCDPLSDYINANYVRGPKGAEKLYIACQAPMDATVEDFWRMVWEQQSKVIIMLTDLKENGVEKCADYLPPNEVTDSLRLFGDYQVTLKKRDVKEKYVISTLQLKNMESNLWREMTHLWYLGWPEQGVPAEANSLIAFLIEARSQIKSSGSSTGPSVVHCSPGTGRTGTVIACDLCIREFEQTRMVDIPKCVFNLRKDRAGAVQTKDQYAFIYQVLNLYATKLTGGGLESI